jgi:hypothetical protein
MEFVLFGFLLRPGNVLAYCDLSHVLCDSTVLLSTVKKLKGNIMVIISNIGYLGSNITSFISVFCFCVENM